MLIYNLFALLRNFFDFYICWKTVFRIIKDTVIWRTIGLSTVLIDFKSDIQVLDIFFYDWIIIPVKISKSDIGLSIVRIQPECNISFLSSEYIELCPHNYIFIAFLVGFN